MSAARWTLTRHSFEAGVWTGRLDGPPAAAPPLIRATVSGRVLAEAAPSGDGPGRWTVRLAFGADVLGAGPVTVLIGPADAPPLAAEVIRAGAAESPGLAAEIADLRAELEVVKAALRRLSARND